MNEMEQFKKPVGTGLVPLGSPSPGFLWAPFPAVLGLPRLGATLSIVLTPHIHPLACDRATLWQ